MLLPPKIFGPAGLTCWRVIRFLPAWGAAARQCGLAFLFFFSASLGFGHDPSASWATVRVQGDTLELRVEMASESAWLVLGESPDSAPDIDHSVPRLRAVAGSVYRLSIGDRVLTPSETSAAQREEDGVTFRLVFARPKGEAPVRFEASYLKRLPADHRTTLTLLDSGDNVMRGEILNAKKPAVELKLPAVAAVAPPTAPDGSASSKHVPSR